MTPIRNDALVAGGVLLAGLTFALDLALPLGVAVAVPYMIPVLLGLWSTRARHALVFAAVGTGLTAAGYFFKDQSLAPLWVVVTNRAVALIAIWAAAAVVSYEQDTRRRLAAREAEKDAARAALERSRHQLEDMRYALDQAAIVAITDRAGRIVYANDKFCEISQYSREELLGQDHRIINSGLHPREFWVEMWKTIGSGRVWRAEIRNRNKGGDFYWVDTTIVPFLDETGRVYQYLAIRTDITERKRNEEILRRQEALVRLGEMSAVIAHEVKNPLTGIAGALQVIGDRMPESSRDRKIVGDMIARIRALHHSLQDLLVFARPRTARLAEIDVKPLLTDTAELLARDPRFQGLSVVIDGEDGQQVLADPELVREAFLNVLINAAQAMEAGGTVNIEVNGTPSVCRISFTDTGPGIPADVRQRVFEPFFTTRTRGTGLGLAIVKRTMDQHNGSIVIEAPPEGGTRVALELPRPRVQPIVSSHTPAVR